MKEEKSGLKKLTNSIKFLTLNSKCAWMKLFHKKTWRSKILKKIRHISKINSEYQSFNKMRLIKSLMNTKRNIGHLLFN